MSLRLYFNHHVRSEIVRELRARHLDLITAAEDSLAAAPDALLLDRATALGRVFFSHDRDLLVLACKRQRDSRAFSGLIYAHQLAITIGQCVADLELLCLACHAGEVENRVIFLPL